MNGFIIWLKDVLDNEPREVQRIVLHDGKQPGKVTYHLHRCVQSPLSGEDLDVLAQHFRAHAVDQVSLLGDNGLICVLSIPAQIRDPLWPWMYERVRHSQGAMLQAGDDVLADWTFDQDSWAYIASQLVSAVRDHQMLASGGPFRLRVLRGLHYHYYEPPDETPRAAALLPDARPTTVGATCVVPPGEKMTLCIFPKVPTRISSFVYIGDPEIIMSAVRRAGEIVAEDVPATAFAAGCPHCVPWGVISRDNPLEVDLHNPTDRELTFAACVHGLELPRPGDLHVFNPTDREQPFSAYIGPLHGQTYPPSPEGSFRRDVHAMREDILNHPARHKALPPGTPVAVRWRERFRSAAERDVVEATHIEPRLRATRSEGYGEPWYIGERLVTLERVRELARKPHRELLAYLEQAGWSMEEVQALIRVIDDVGPEEASAPEPGDLIIKPAWDSHPWQIGDRQVSRERLAELQAMGSDRCTQTLRGAGWSAPEIDALLQLE